MEGTAREGPLAAQVVALAVLAADVRTRHPLIRNLGHRDFADYKWCPGKLIDWSSIGGHGPVKEEDMPGLSLVPSPTLVAGRVTVPPTEVIRVSDRERIQTTATATNRPAVGPYDIVDIASVQRGYLVYFTSGLAWVRESALTFTPDPIASAYPVTVGGKAVGTVSLP